MHQPDERRELLRLEDPAAKNRVDVVRAPGGKVSGFFLYLG
jgi:hypothetical protein